MATGLFGPSKSIRGANVGVRGRRFAGVVTLKGGDALGNGPLVVKGLVRVIAGELVIETNPRQGSRLEITVPQKPEAAYGQ